MKLQKIIVYTLSIFIFLQAKVIASGLIVQNFASPIKIANKISQPINIAFSADGNWRLLVEAIDFKITNQDYPSCFVPITRLELAEVGGFPISIFEMGKTIEIKNGDFQGSTNFNLAINANVLDCDRPGNYVADIKFTLLDKNNIVAEEFFSFRFRQEEISSIDFTKRIVNLNVEKDKALEKNCSQNLPTPLGVYVSSNKNWKLYVRRLFASKENQINYFIRTVSAEDKINLNASGEYIRLDTAPILLATGKSTINEAINILEKKLINIDYLIKGPENEYLPEGSFSEDLEYRLETED